MRIQVTGQSLNDAIENAMIELSTTSDNVAYDIIKEGSEGFLGIGAKPYVIEAYKKDDKEEAYKAKNVDKKEDKLIENEKGTYEFKSSNNRYEKSEKKTYGPTNRDQKEVEGKIKEFLEPIFKEFEATVNINIEFKKEEGNCNIDLSGDKMGIIIGKHGQTLDAIQHLTNIYVNKGETDKVHIKIDSENYRNKRYKTLESLAKSVANNVRKTRTGYALEPMPSYERKIIHSILQKERNITTESIGEERKRHVVVKYRGK